MRKILVMIMLMAFASPVIAQDAGWFGLPAIQNSSIEISQPIQLPQISPGLNPVMADPMNKFIKSRLMTMIRTELENGRLTLCKGKSDSFKERASFWLDAGKPKNIKVIVLDATGVNDLINIVRIRKDGTQELLFTAEFNERGVCESVTARISEKKLFKIESEKDLFIGNLYLRTKALPIGLSNEFFEGEYYCFQMKCIVLNEKDLPDEFKYFIDLAYLLSSVTSDLLQQDATHEMPTEEWLDGDLPKQNLEKVR